MKVEAIDKKVNQQLPEPLSNRVVKGGLWVFASRMINRSLGLTRTIVLARLLAPEDFGLLGIALLAIAMLDTFSQPGFQTALIQKQQRIESYLDTAWTVSAIRGTILFLILFCAAPFIARFFNSQQATLVIRVLAISTLLSGFTNVGVLFFQKELEFNKQFCYDLSTTLVDLSVAVSLAFILRNVWALVWGGLAGNFARLFMSYLLHPYRPRIMFDREKFQDLLAFGKWLLGSGILIFLITQGDDIFVGKMLGVTALGFYQMAYLLSNLPATEITHIISQVTFPAYSKLQEDLPKLGEAYLKVLQLTAFLSLPLAGIIFLLAPEFTNLFLGKRWIPMVSAMQALVLWGMIRSLGATTGPVFISTGNPEILTKLQFVVLTLLLILIFPLTIRWGILGTSLAVLISALIPNLAAVYMVLKIVQCKGSEFFRVILPSIINTGIIVLILSVLKIYWITTFGVSEFILIIILSILIYLGLTYLYNRFFGFYEETFDFLQKRV